MSFLFRNLVQRQLSCVNRSRYLSRSGALLLVPLLAVSHPAFGVATGDIVASDILNDVAMFSPERQWGDLAMDPAGNVTAVWIGNVSGSNYSLAGARLYPSLQGVAPGFSISQSQVAQFTRPSVKADASGRFVAAWTSEDTDGMNVQFRCFEADISSTPRIEQTQANDIVDGDQSAPSIAMNADGSFTLLWQHAPTADGANTAIYARDYTADCTPSAASYEVYAAPDGASVSAMMADGDSVGDAVLAWLEDNGAAGWEVKARRLGAPQLSAFTVASGATITDGASVSVASTQAADGDFVVSWVAQEDTTKTLYAQRYNADGTATTANPTLLHTNPYIRYIDTSMDALGRLGLTLSEELLYDAPYTRTAYVRQYDAQMSPLYDLTTLRNNNYYFWSLAIASDADGDLLAGWTDGSSQGFYGKRFSGPEPVDVSVAVDNKPGRTDMERLELTVTVTNNHSVNPDGGMAQGIGASSGLTVQVTPPAGSSKVATWLGDWTCDYAFLCTRKKPLGAGMTDQFNIYFDNVPLGTASTSVTLMSNHVDPALTNNEASVNTRVCNDYGYIGFDVTDPNIHVSETSGQYSAPIRRTGGTCGTVSTRVTTIPPLLYTWPYSGVAGEDFTDIDEQLVWADGESGTKTVSVPIIDDEQQDGNKQFEVRVTDITSASLGGNSHVLVTIEDDESNTTPSVSDSSTGGSDSAGGGGSTDLSLLLLCMLPWLSRRRGEYRKRPVCIGRRVRPPGGRYDRMLTERVSLRKTRSVHRFYY